MQSRAAIKNETLEYTASAVALASVCRFQLRTLEEAVVVSRMAADFFADPDRVEPGIRELIQNAIEHGCLGIGFNLKSRLLERNSWEAEVNRRLSLPENREKRVDVIVTRKEEGVVIVITDTGHGFDWKNWLTPDSSRAADKNGRGIARARSVSFDNITYNAEGNRVAAYCRNTPDIVW